MSSGLSIRSGSSPTQRVLVVDDNPQIQEDFRKILTPRATESALDQAEAALFGGPVTSSPARAVLQIDAAHQGELAVELVRRAVAAGAPYCVGFVDLRMPAGWDGVQTVRALWQIDPDVQIVLCTAYSDYSWEDMVGELGSGDNFLILKKPFDAMEVRQLVQALGAKWSLLRQRADHLRTLEQQVQNRTEKLATAMEQLRREMEDRLQLEKDLRHAQKLDALGRMIAGIGHEINNPLAYVVNNLEYARGELLKLAVPSPPELTEAIEEAAAGAERIRNIIQSAREFSRPWEEPPSPVDLRDCVAGALKIVHHQLRQRAQVVTSFADAPRVLADPHRLEQVLVNLLMNAFHALSEDRAEHEIRVTTARASDSRVQISVIDSGRGIPERDLDRVFEPFFSTRPLGQGTGLGLWICRKIVESFGGSIQLTSQVGIGTSVCVTLPVASVTATESQASAAVKATAGPGLDGAAEPDVEARAGRILLVDDEPAILRSLKRLLAGHEVVMTTDPRQGLSLYREQHFDVVLCDLMMPGLGGIEFLRELERVGPEHARRVVMMTGGAFTDPMRESFARLTNPCIAKPFRKRELLGLIQKQLAERSLAPVQETARVG